MAQATSRCGRHMRPACEPQMRRASALRLSTDGRTDGLTKNLMQAAQKLQLGNAHTRVRHSLWITQP